MTHCCQKLLPLLPLDRSFNRCYSIIKSLQKVKCGRLKSTKVKLSHYEKHDILLKGKDGNILGKKNIPLLFRFNVQSLTHPKFSLFTYALFTPGYIKIIIK